MNKILHLIIFLLTGAMADAQYIRYTVQLKDKKGSNYSLSQPAAFLSARSIQRRAKQNIVIDSTDLPVSQVYLDSISKINGVSVLYTSKWLNNVLVEITDSAATGKINSLPFVHHLTPVALVPRLGKGHVINKSTGDEKLIISSSPHVFGNNSTLADTLNYGQNYQQVHIHEGEYLHQLGFRGQGIVIAVIDAGFRNYQTNPAFDSLRANNQILGEYDFVNREVDVNADDPHGANCLSIIAANMPGQMIGTAPKASFYLFKSEEVAYEKPVEEEFWVVAAERADSAGSDMISSSLGYSNFDDTTLNLNYAQRDGKTAPITICANMAFKKGMIVCSSSGNSGQLPNDFKYAMCPADGDNVFAIGAIGTNGIIAPWSSGGPNGAGKLKPNVVSVGSAAVFVNINGNPSVGSGTSYSNPNMAGLVACLWQAFSDVSNADILDAIERSADRYTHPDNRYGYGIPNMRIAYQLLAAKKNQRLTLEKQNTFIEAYPIPFTQSFNVFLKAPASGTATIRILDVEGRLIFTQSQQVDKYVYYNIYVNPFISSPGIYYLQYDDGKNTSVIRLVHL